MTISQELEQRSIMVTYSTGQIVGGSGENQVNAENIEAFEAPVPFVRGHIRTEQTNIFTHYQSVDDPKEHNVETEQNDNQIPLSRIQQLDLEGNVGVNDPSLQTYMLQPHFKDDRAPISYQALDNMDQYINQNYPDNSNNHEFEIANPIDGSYNKGNNILLAAEKNISEQNVQSAIDSSVISQCDNSNIALMEPSNIAMMIQQRPIAPAHASPVVYAEAANTAILSSSAVHHQILSEDGNNNDGIREDVDDNDTRRDFLKEQALAHGFESGV